MKILLLYFEPFGTDTVNAGEEATGQLPSETDGIEIFKHRLPVSYSGCVGHSAVIVDAVGPDMIICLGQAAGRATICLERVAVNVMSATMADNDGVVCDNIKINVSGPDAILTDVPVERVAAQLRQAGYPCFVSNTAGTFVCNRLYYGLMNRYPQVPTLFIHIPLTPAQAALRTSSTPSMSPQTVAEAVSMVCKCCKTML